MLPLHIRSGDWPNSLLKYRPLTCLLLCWFAILGTHNSKFSDSFLARNSSSSAEKIRAFLSPLGNRRAHIHTYTCFPASATRTTYNFLHLVIFTHIIPPFWLDIIQPLHSCRNQINLGTGSFNTIHTQINTHIKHVQANLRLPASIPPYFTLHQ